MSTASLRRRIERLESRSRRERRDPVVISNIGARGEFYGEHGRFKTDAEMDEEERALRLAGRLGPNEEAVRVIIHLVDPAGNEVEPKGHAWKGREAAEKVRSAVLPARPQPNTASAAPAARATTAAVTVPVDGHVVADAAPPSDTKRARLERRFIQAGYPLPHPPIQ